jgi:CTP:molybdopterin cytidylyltransferase MocA
VGLVLAAGASRRLGFPKALARYDGATILQRIADTLRLGGCSDVLVVVSEPHAAAIRAAHPTLRFITNPTPDTGMLGSLWLGLEACRMAGVTELVVALLDQPRISPTTVRCLRAAAAGSSAGLFVPCFLGRRGHPLLLELNRIQYQAPEPNQTMRDYLGCITQRVEVAVEDAAILDDLDTPEDARRLAIRLESS